MARRKRNKETRERDARMHEFYEEAHARYSEKVVEAVEKIRLRGIKTRKAV